MKYLCCLFLLGVTIGHFDTGCFAQHPNLYDETRLRTIELTFSQTGWWELLRKNYATKVAIKADLKFNGVTYRSVGVRFRGNSWYKNSGASKKKPFEIAMDAFVPGQRLLGFKTLNLNNGFKDPTFIREVLLYNVFRRFMPAPQANFIRLVINGKDWGPYVNVQQVNTDFIRTWFRDDDGNRYRCDSQPGVPDYKSGLIWLGKEIGPYQKSYALKSGPKPGAWIDLVHLIDVLNHTPTNSMQRKLPGVLDVDEALWHIACLNTFLVLDSYLGSGAHNFYLYNDGYHGRFSILPWDLNSGFGTDGDWIKTPQVIVLDPMYRATDWRHPLVKNLVGVPEWRNRYLAHIRTLLDRYFDWSKLGPMAKAYQDLIDSAVKNDPIKLYDYKYFRLNLTKDVGLTQGRFYFFPGLQPLVDKRRAFLLKHAELDKLRPDFVFHGQDPVEPAAKDAVWILGRAQERSRVASMTLFHRVRGAYSTIRMVDDGKHRDGKAGDGIYGGRIPPYPSGSEVEFYLRATAPSAKGGAMAFHPEASAIAPLRYEVHWPHSTLATLRINEFLAVNETGIRDEKGEREDWIELINTGTASIPVAGYFLTDDLSNPRKWAIPAGYSLAPGQALTIWADDEKEGPLHASFKLSGAGETLALFQPDGRTLVDRITFGKQWPDRSSGRLAGPPEVWVTFADPTPGKANRPLPYGHLRYSNLAADQPYELVPTGTPRIGQVVKYTVRLAAVGSSGILMIGGVPIQQDISRFGTLLVWEPRALFPLYFSATGEATVPIPVPSNNQLVGVELYFQAGVIGGDVGFTNAVLTRVGS